MARHIHLDPTGGMAGDMFVSAMLDAFPELQDPCWRDLSDAGVLAHLHVELNAGTSHGLAAKRLHIAQTHSPAKRTGNYTDLCRWLETGNLREPVKQRALALLTLLAEAEAYVHGVPLSKVHFHEVADWDSLLDVVAAASLIEHSQVDSWSCASIPLGSGTVQTEHGELPVPAPATSYLLNGMNVHDDGEPGERVTPTGAAILRYVLGRQHQQTAQITTAPSGQMTAVGSGAGTRELQHRPNIVRVLVIDQPQADSDDNACENDQVVEISFDIDDMTPEEMSVSLDHIRATEGVLDAGLQLGVGKKGRVCFHVVVLCHLQHESGVCRQCFLETTTIGMRMQRLDRIILRREQHLTADKYGKAGVKVVERSGSYTAKVESDDLAALPGLHARRDRARRLLSHHES